MDERLFDTSTEFLRRSGGPQGCEVVYGRQPGNPAPCPGEAIVYLPGLQGDWSGMFRFAPIVRRQWRLVELSYPRRPEWGLADYVERLRRAMDAEGLDRAHILAESFGSTVGWAFAFAYPRRVRSLIFAGGFAQPVKPWGIPVPQGLIEGAPLWVREQVIRGAIGLMKRSRWGPRGDEDAAPWLAGHRGAQGWRAVRTRMEIVKHCDWRPWLREVTWPVAYLGGGWDEVVPVRREARTVRGLLPAGITRMTRILPRTPHPVLFVEAEASARFVGDWFEVLQAER